jgi:polar amino acid transport system substrate-binding protein
VRRTVAATVAALLSTLAVACGGGPDGTTVRVATLFDSRPAAYSAGGRFTGFDNELFRAIAAKEGLRLEFVGTDFSSLLGQVANGQVDVGSAAISQTEDRKKSVDFSNAYNYEALGIVATATSSVTDENSMAGKRIGVVRATIADIWVAGNEPAARVVRFPDDNALIAALSGGTVDAAVLDKANAALVVTRNAGLKVTKSFDTLLPQGYAVRKGNGALLTEINNGLQQVIADGTWLRLHRQFEPNEDVPPEFDGNP